MYEDFKAIMERILADVSKRIQTDKTLLEKCPDGRMMQGVNNKGKDVFRIVGRGKTRIRTVISKDKEMQMLLAKKALLKNEIDKLTQVRSVVLGALEKMDQIQDMDSLRFLIANYPWLPDETVRKICSSGSIRRGWESEPYEQSDYMPEHRTMMTSRGLLVRSKSELLIAEALYRHGISFRYEQVLWIDGRIRLVPDFTIMKADGSIVYWEHRGRMDLRDYAGRQLRKDELYASVGIVPWKNLIVTYDTEDGDIDLRVIESEIRNKLL